MLELDTVHIKYDSRDDWLTSRKVTIEIIGGRGFECADNVRATIVRDLEANLAAKLAERPSEFGDKRKLLLSLFFSILSVSALASACSLLQPVMQSNSNEAERCPVSETGSILPF